MICLSDGGFAMPEIYEGCIQCPFFKRIAEQSITCEGITDECVIRLIFKSKKEKNLHRRIFCDKNYKNCEIYTILEKKYEE
jgi:hypothetical protein